MLKETQDMSCIAALMRDPACWPWVSGDGTPQDWAPRPVRAPGAWLLVRTTESSGHSQGVFLIEPDGEMHLAFLPDARGRAALQALRALFSWARARGFRALWGGVARHNLPARMLVSAAGMQRRAVAPAAQARGGRLHDVIIYAIDLTGEVE
jgi:RimJ/RimL family protein N-acetyltransferase